MNPYTQLAAQDPHIGLGWEMLVSEAAYKVVSAIEKIFARR